MTPVSFNNEADELIGYEPYELSEISLIARQVKKKIDKIQSRIIKIKHLSLALEKINLILKNAQSAYDYLERQGATLESEDFYDKLDQAHNIRKQIEIEIYNLQLAELEDANVSEPQSQEAAPVVKTSIPEPYSEIMDVEEVARYLKLKESTIYHLASEGKIPKIKIGGSLRFRKTVIDEWVDAEEMVAEDTKT